jgi:adenylate cyclase
MAPVILVVDDEPDLEEVVLQHFHRQICERTVRFLFARDGLEALRSIENNPEIEVVLLDINMPRMDGLSTLQRLQEADEKKSVVIVSAYGDIQNIRAAMNRGAFDFLTKPIDFEDLEATIKKAVQHERMVQDIKRRQIDAEKAYSSLSRYFSPQLAAQLTKGGDANGVAVHLREIAVIFTDITDFLSLVEKIEPSTLADVLNEYMVGMTEIVFSHDGTVAKIIGDAIQVLFNAPSDQPDYLMRAVSCAKDLDSWAQDFRKRWASKGIGWGATRIGVHAGPALVGNFGGARFFDYTAHGDVVNTVARLEAANKLLGTRICVSDAIAKGVTAFCGRPIGQLMLRGRSRPLSAFEPLSDVEFGRAETTEYLRAYSKLESEDPSAMPAFAALVAADATDSLSGYHLKRLLNGATGAKIRIE